MKLSAVQLRVKWPVKEYAYAIRQWSQEGQVVILLDKNVVKYVNCS